jgi:transketolase
MAKIATREAYGKTLVELGEEIQDIVVLDADLSQSTKTVFFAKKFPERFFNMGIAEQNLMGTAAGFAASGKIPFASTFAVFATGRAFEQIRNSICYPKLNVKIAATHAGLTVGEDGATHQAIEDLAIMRALPNMTVICPADSVETELAVRAAVLYDGPVYLRLGRLAVETIFDENYEFKLGRGVTLREGKDIAIIATGIMVNEAIKAAQKLKKTVLMPW